MFPNGELREIEFLIGTGLDLDELKHLPPLQLGDQTVLFFAREVASLILKNRKYRQNLNLSALAVWLHSISTGIFKSSLKTFHNKWGRGLVFHIAPANVPLNFAYSLFTGLISGNANVIRLSSRESEDINMFIEILKELLKREAHKIIRERIVIVKFAKESEWTSLISSRVDGRIIWGGDAGIHAIRSNKIPANAIEVVFPNKYSICVLNAEKVVNLKSKEDLFRRFYNDTFLSDQNACSSPLICIWLGDENLVRKAKDEFWSEFTGYASARYEVPAFQVQAKFELGCRIADLPNFGSITFSKDGLIWRVELADPIDLADFKGSCGFFYEARINSVEELSKFFNRHVQTISEYGINREELYELFVSTPFFGAERLVEVGNTLNFDFKWDGNDLLNMLSRERVFL
jgi:hypothetical protein